MRGYARVSEGDEQNNALQTKALRAAGCRRLFEETASGGRWDRPELHRLLDDLRDGDTVVVWKLDRLSRSLKDVLHITEQIGNAGAGFRSITENIDTATSAGRMMMQMVGAWRRFHRPNRCRTTGSAVQLCSRRVDTPTVSRMSGETISWGAGSCRDECKRIKIFPKTGGMQNESSANAHRP